MTKIISLYFTLNKRLVLISVGFTKTYSLKNKCSGHDYCLFIPISMFIICANWAVKTETQLNFSFQWHEAIYGWNRVASYRPFSSPHISLIPQYYFTYNSFSNYSNVRSNKITFPPRFSWFSIPLAENLSFCSHSHILIWQKSLVMYTWGVITAVSRTELRPHLKDALLLEIYQKRKFAYHSRWRQILRNILWNNGGVRKNGSK